MTESTNVSKTIRDLAPGDKITGFFIVRKKELQTKKDGAPYLRIGLGDNTGRISATIWDNAKAVYETFNVGDIVKVKGSVVTFRDSIQLSVARIRKAEPSDGVEKETFLKKGEIDTDALFRQLIQKTESVKNPHLRRLLERIFKNPEWEKRFQEAPGGKLWHHAYLGGLLEHTMAVVEVCETMARLYPMADRDLLIAGAILHDLGKLDEYGYDQGFIDFTDEGRLWGHISIGAQKVRSIIEELEKEEGFPDEPKKQIIHLVLSHQGKLEHGSPVLPQTLEAIILYYADEMDAKANALKHIIERDKEPGRKWSQYVNLLERYIYLKDDDSPEEESSS